MPRSTCPLSSQQRIWPVSASTSRNDTCGAWRRKLSTSATPAKRLAGLCDYFGVRTAFQEGGENDPVNQIAAYHVDRETSVIDMDEAQRLADSYLKPLLNAYDALIGEGVAKGVFRPVDPQLFYFTVIGAADRFFSARLVLKHCSDTDVLDEALRDRYRAHLNDFVVAGILVAR